MEAILNTSTDASTPADHSKPSTSQDVKEKIGGIFTCSYCSLEEKFDYKGAKPPFARQLVYLEDCYIMKDPFSLPNKGEVLVLGADCSVCNKPVCLGCSIFFAKRFCSKCATDNIQYLPPQLHAKIKGLVKESNT